MDRIHAKVGDKDSCILEGLFTIEVEMRMTDQYLEMSVVDGQSEVFLGELLGQPLDGEIYAMIVSILPCCMVIWDQKSWLYDDMGFGLGHRKIWVL